MSRLRTESDEGITLIEMMVVVSILGTILAIVSQGMLQAQRIMTDNAARLDGLSQTNVAIEGMTRVLRTAILPSQVQASCSGCDTAAFIAGNEFQVEFYANVNNDGILPSSGTTDLGPRRVTYEVSDQGVLTETVQKPNVHSVSDFDYQYCVPGPSCPVAERVLARDVELINDDGTPRPVFTYYDRFGEPIDPPLDSDAKRKAVDSIDLLLSVLPSERADSVTVAARVTLPNADSVIQPTPTPEL